VILRSIPRAQRYASYRGRVMIDTVRGVLRVRKWPKKRGPPKSAKQRFWIDWFTQANLLAKYADPMSQVRAIEMTKGTGLYPRDVLLSAMRGRLYWWTDDTGWKWFPMAATQDVSNSLDTIAQVVGSVLVRAVDRWRTPPPAAIGNVLTYKGDAASPLWEAPGGGLAQVALTGTPIVPDNTVNNYVLDVSADFSVQLMYDQLGQATSGQPQIQFSTDGGVSYKSGATDYQQVSTDAITQTDTALDRIWTTPIFSGSGHDLNGFFNMLRAGRANYALATGKRGNRGMHRGGFCTFDGPITHIKIFTNNGSNFNAGSIRATGLRAA